MEKEKIIKLEVTEKGKWWVVVKSEKGYEYTLTYLFGIDAVGIFRCIDETEKMIDYFHGGYDNSGEICKDTLEFAESCIKNYEINM